MIPKRTTFQTGFTLLEVLLVIVIIGIMATIGVGLVNSQSAERQLQAKAGQWQKMLTYMCQQSILNQRAYGLELAQQSIQVLVFDQQAWQSNLPLTQALPTEGLAWSIQLDGRDMPLAEKLDNLPHVVCASDGQINPFDLQISLNQLPDIIYEITTDGPWRIKGVWQD